jgi:ParB/RepB/Spo0J family partition protein
MKENTPKIEMIAIETLTRDPNHPRQTSGDLKSLIASIRHEGLISPISVAKTGDGQYHVIDGWRRVEALKQLGAVEVPCFVYEDLKEADAAHKSYVLNTERNQLNEIEIALHIKKMRDDFGYTFQELEILGYGSRANLSKQVKLLDLPAKIQKQIASGTLTKAHGIELNKVNDGKMIPRVAKMAVTNEWSAKKLRDSIDRMNRKASKAAKKEAPIPTPDHDVPGVYFKDAKDMAELADNSVGLIFTSPPYHVGMEFEAGYTYAEHLENIKAVLQKCAKVLVPGGVFAINVANITNFKGEKGTEKPSRIQPMLHVYNSILKKYGFHLQDEIIWFKGFNSFTKDIKVNYSDETAHAEYRIVHRHEPIYIFKKKGERPVPEDENIILQSRLSRSEWQSYAPSIWQINSVRGDKGHPCVFPDELARRIIRMYSYVGETVLDPFLGSGTTIKVARELRRQGIGYERDLRYKATIMEKLGLTHVAPADEERLDDLPEDGKELAMGMGISKSVEASQASEDQTESDSEPEVSLIMSEGIRKEFNERAETALEPA